MSDEPKQEITQRNAAAANPIVQLLKLEIVAHEIGHLLATALLHKDEEATYIITPGDVSDLKPTGSPSASAWSSVMRDASPAQRFITIAGGPMSGAGFSSRIGFSGDPSPDAWRDQSGLTLLARAMRVSSTSRSDIEKLLEGGYKPHYDPILRALWLAGMQMLDRAEELVVISKQLRKGEPVEFSRKGVLHFAPDSGPDVDLIAREAVSAAAAIATKQREEMAA